MTIGWRNVIFNAVCLALFGCNQLAAGETVVSKTFTYRTSLRAVAFAQKAETFTNPLTWPQIVSCAPDGSYVKQGQTVIEFDRQHFERELQAELLRRDVVDAQLARKLTELRNRNLQLRDELEELEDNLAVLKSRQERYQALPDPHEVEIYAGRLRVAELAFDAAQKDLAKADDRLARNMISKVERDAKESDFRLQQARLTQARRHLEYAQLPATESTLRKLQLQIENLELERDKLKHEVEENALISEIQKRGAAAQKEIIDNKIKEKREELEKTTLPSPLAGYLLHMRQFKVDVLEGGSKMWKNAPFMEIPNLETIAFKGMLLESERKFFQPGDAVSLRCHTRKAEPLDGTILSISKFSHDQGEKEEVDWGDRQKSGVMVYDLVIQPKRRPDWLRIGMHADCELTSGQTFSGPAVPLAYLKERDGQFHLAVEGVFQKVSGSIVDEWFLLDDSAWLGRRVTPDGSFPDQVTELAAKNSGLATWTGNLTPVDTADVTVKRIYRWQKISWLMPEDTFAKKGEVVAKLDTRETQEEIKKQESLYRQAKSNLESLTEEAKLKARESTFQLRRETNLLTIAEIDLDVTENGRDSPGIFDAALAATEAKIQEERLSQELERMAARRADFVSPTELARLRRDVHRSQLKQEAAALRLAELRRGADEVDREKARLALLRQQRRVETLTKETETDEVRRAQEQRRAEQQEAHRRRQLNQLREQLANLTLTAPRDGVVQYNKIYDYGKSTITKASVGTVIGYRFVPIGIADISRMFIRIEVPEKYFTAVKPDMPVDVRIPSLSEETLAGTVTEIEFLFESKRKKDTQRGLYSAHEPLGETVFFVHVEVAEQKGIKLKPGAVAQVTFPFKK